MIKCKMIVILLLISINVYAVQTTYEELGYVEQSNGWYSVGLFNVTSEVFTCWSNVFVSTEQLPLAGPYRGIKYVFDKGEKPDTVKTIKDGMTTISFPPKYFHIYGKTNIVVSTVNPPMKCVLNFRGNLICGFEYKGRFFCVEKLKDPKLKNIPIRQGSWEETNIKLPIHRTNELETLKRKYIEDYEKNILKK